MHGPTNLNELFAFFFVKYMIIDVFNKYNSHGNTPFKLQRRLHLEEGKPTT